MYDRLYVQIQCVESLKRRSFILMKLHIFLYAAINILFSKKHWGI